MSCHVMSCHLTSCHVLSRPVISCHVISRPLTSSHVLSCHVMSCHVMSCHVWSCHVTSSHVLSRLVISCHRARESSFRIFLPSLLNSSIMAAGWPRRGFRNRGPLRESGSERRSRCGAACTASVCVWRRAHFWDLGIVLRGRLRGSGVLEVCRGHAAALCRGDWVPGAFCTCMANVRFAWQAAGIVRAGRCVAGVSRVCRGRSAVGIGFRACRARMILRAATCVSRGRRGTSDALMRSGRHWTVDPRGRRNESCAGAKIAGFRGPVRQIACAGARVGRCEIVAGAGNPWICGCELGADVSWNAAAGCGGRVARSALSRGTQWQAVTMGVGRVARVALCHGDCCWACRVGGAVPWGLLLGVSRGWRCAMGIAAGRLAWVSLGGPLSRWRRVLGIADQGMVWVAPCH